MVDEVRGGKRPLERVEVSAWSISRRRFGSFYSPPNMAYSTDVPTRRALCKRKAIWTTLKLQPPTSYSHQLALSALKFKRKHLYAVQLRFIGMFMVWLFSKAEQLSAGTKRETGHYQKCCITHTLSSPLRLTPISTLFACFWEKLMYTKVSMNCRLPP